MVKLDKQIRLGTDKLLRELYVEPINRCTSFNKPKGGLWCSTYTPNEEYLSDWHRFCANEFTTGLNNHAVIFDFKPNSRIFQIDSQKDLMELFHICGRFYDDILPESICLSFMLDFEEAKARYDVINLTERGQWTTRLPMTNPKYNLYGWDTECSLILNFDCIGEQEYKYFNLIDKDRWAIEQAEKYAFKGLMKDPEAVKELFEDATKTIITLIDKLKDNDIKEEDETEHGDSK